jgi:iron complex outermembrane receptor protein
MKLSSLFRALVVALVFLFQPVTFAEETEQKYAMLEEVITTARKRSEPLQDTPVASTVIGGRDLDFKFHGDLKTLPFPAPNVNIAGVSAFSNAVSVAIRGISNSDIDSTVDPPVGVFIDGVYMARPVASSMDLFDVEQIEVLRGPQGTLFGRNTSAGALQIRTRRPSGEFGVRGKINAGEYGRVDLRGVVDFPISDTIAAKISVMSMKMDGFFESAINGDDLGEEDIIAIRPMIQFNPTDDLEIVLIGEYHRNKSEPRPQQNQSPPSRLLCVLHGFCGFDFGDGDEFTVESIDVGSIDAEIWGLTAEVNYTVDTGVFTFIGNYRDTDEEVIYDPDAVLYPMFLVDRDQPHNQYSAEFRFQSTGSDKFDYVAGIYYFHQEYDLVRHTSLAVVAPPPFTLISITGQDHDAWSVFGELNYHVSDDLTLTFGARYSDEEKDFYQQPFGIPAAGARIDQNESWSNFGPKFGINYQWNADLMTYFTFTKGFKSGGFNGRCGQTATCLLNFDPEEVDGYEFGIKADWLNNRLRTNIAIFYSEYEDMQRGAIVPLPPGAANPQETVTDNAAGATLMGIEFEMSALIGNNLKIDVAVGVLDAEYDAFCADIDGAGAFDSTPTSDCGGSVTQTTNLDNPGGPGAYLVDADRSAFDLARAPELNYSINATYELPLSNGGNVVFNASYLWVDDMFTDSSENSLREDTDLLDASISYEAPDGKYRVSLYGKNLSDEIYVDSRTIVPPLFDTRAVSSPRRYGVEFSFQL